MEEIGGYTRTEGFEIRSQGDYVMGPEYPSILRRYLSTVTDGFLIISVLIMTAYIFPADTGLAKILRIGIGFGMLFLYEPIFTSRFCTLGQKIMGIRVREIISLQKISIPKAYLRILIKIFLGLISFFSILFSKDKRAIHDFVVGSIVMSHVPF